MLLAVRNQRCELSQRAANIADRVDEPEFVHGRIGSRRKMMAIFGHDCSVDVHR
jgi:hypothetical protein